MLAARFHVLTTILPLLTFISLATTDPVCDMIYGRPKYTDCLDLVNGLRKGSSPEEDRRQLYFAVRGQDPPPWIPYFAQAFWTRVPITLRQS